MEDFTPTNDHDSDAIALKREQQLEAKRLKDAYKYSYGGTSHRSQISAAYANKQARVSTLSASNDAF